MGVSRHPEIRGMFLQSPIDSGGKAVFGNAVAWVAQRMDIFKNYEKIGRVKCPVLVMHGTADSVVPCRCGRAIHHACSNAHSPLWVEGRGHNDMPTDACLQRVGDFLDDIVSVGPIARSRS